MCSLFVLFQSNDFSPSHAAFDEGSSTLKLKDANLSVLYGTCMDGVLSMREMEGKLKRRGTGARGERKIALLPTAPPLISVRQFAPQLQAAGGNDD